MIKGKEQREVIKEFLTYMCIIEFKKNQAKTQMGKR
jgi:hypothetical protein